MTAIGRVGARDALGQDSSDGTRGEAGSDHEPDGAPALAVTSPRAPEFKKLKHQARVDAAQYPASSVGGNGLASISTVTSRTNILGVSST
jgi:hypothetical protein